MIRCAFLTTENLENYVQDDQLAMHILAQQGWDTQLIPWRDQRVDWDAYDLVIVRSTWDYHDATQQFLERLKTIDSSSARLENPYDIIAWNVSKYYLKDLQARGIPVVPTDWGENLTPASWKAICALYPDTPFVIKPVISASAQDTFLVQPWSPEPEQDTILQTFSKKQYMVQPFIKSIVEEGEYSLFFFNGIYSHSILKTPGANDFRVQEEHGGRIVATQPSSLLLDRAREVLGSIEQSVLYARIDLVKNEINDYALMELELIEPSLYLRMDSGAPERFAMAIQTLI